MKRLLVLFVCYSLLCGALAKKKKKRKSHKEIEQFVGSTHETLIMEHPVALQAKKMSRLLKRQDVVSTCRYMLFKAYKNFYDAKHACENVEWPFTHNGVKLAYIKSAEENNEMRILLQLAHGIRFKTPHWDKNNWAWVGLEKKINNDVRISKKQRKFNASEWEWLDGTHPTFSKWGRDMPDQAYNRKYKSFQKNVMYNKRGYWDDTHAEIKAPYACNYCGKYIVIEEHVKWSQAKKLCVSYGLKMAIVNTRQDNIELAWAANITFGPDTETKRWNNTNWIWLGTHEALGDDGMGTGQWVHHDGTSLDWRPKWDNKRQPDNWVKRRGEQSVAAFSRINQKWDDSFPWLKRPYACMCPHRACHYPDEHEHEHEHDDRK